MENNQHQFNILYAEDESLTRLFVSKLLGGIGNVTVAKDGREALDLYTTNSFDILITDLSMPKMNGRDLVLHIRETDQTVPIIITSAYRDDFDDLKDLVYFIEKPINSKAMLALVQSELNKHLTD